MFYCFYRSNKNNFSVSLKKTKKTLSDGSLSFSDESKIPKWEKYISRIFRSTQFDTEILYSY